LIHSKLRNKLLHSRVEKLFAIRSNLSISVAKKKQNNSKLTTTVEEENMDDSSDCSIESVDSIDELYSLAQTSSIN